MKKTISILLLLFIASTATSKAQMFSVTEDSRKSDPFAPYLRVGVKSIDFAYKGDLQFPPEENPTFQLSGITYTFAFESGGLTLQASLGNNLSGLDTFNYFDLGISFMNPFYLVRQNYFQIGVPIKLSSLVTNMRNANHSEEFAQTNLSVGAGLITQFHFPNILGTTLQIIPNYGFSSASGGFIGGSVFTLNGKARINFYNLLFGKNISLGYDYSYIAYDIDDDQFDYNFNAHSLTLGISL